MATETELDPNAIAADPDAYAEDREARFLETLAEDDEIALDEPGEAAEPAEATETQAEEPEAGEATPEAAADPLADATPFRYTVDGQERTFDGIRVLAGPDGQPLGGVIPADQMRVVQDRLQRADFLEAQDKARWEKMRDYETIEVKTHTGEALTGMAAVQHALAEHAKLTAAVQLMASVLEDPEKLAALYGDPREMQLLARELALTAQGAERQARDQFSARSQQVRQQDTVQQDRAAITTNALTGAIDHWAQQFPALTQDDRQKAVAYFQKLGSHVVRPATPDEAKAAGVKPGELIIDHPVVYEYLQDRAELRKQASASTTAATKAALENAARLKAAAKPKAKASPSKPATPDKPVDKLDEWQAQKLRMMSGNFSTDDE